MKKIYILTVILIIMTMTMSSYISASAENKKIDIAKIAKLESTKPGKLKIKIKKVKNCTGYIIKLSQNKSFSNAKTYRIKNNKKTISGLNQGKKYYVKARTYEKIKINGKYINVYGKWSKVKSMTTKLNEKDKERREEIKNKIGITFSEDVHFLNYTCNQFIYENFNNAMTYCIFAKVKINKSDLKKLLYKEGFYKIKKTSLPSGIENGNKMDNIIPLANENKNQCDWWDLKKSNCKSFYKSVHPLYLTESIIVKSPVYSYIAITKNEDKNGYMTAYLVLQ